MITSYNELVAAKIAIINYHKGDEFEYTRQSIARDACYTSFNSIEWKSEQMSKLRNELAILYAEAGQEVVDVNIGRKVTMYQKMEEELAELLERHKADCEAFHAITGETWTRKPKRTHKSDGLGDKAELERILGKAVGA